MGFCTILRKGGLESSWHQDGKAISASFFQQLQTLETLMDTGLDITSSISQEKKSQDSPKEYFLKLVDGDFLLHVMELM